MTKSTLCPQVLLDTASPLGNRRRMRWEEMLLDLFEDLEQQAEGLALAERDLELAELSRAEYAQVGFAARLHASLMRPVTLGVQGVGPVTGELARAGQDWCLVATGAPTEADDGRRPRQEWIVRTPAVLRARGLSDRGVDEGQRPLSARLGLGSVLRSIAAARGDLVVHLGDGTMLRGQLRRVGADFAELRVSGARGEEAGHDDELVPFTAMAAVRRT